MAQEMIEHTFAGPETAPAGDLPLTPWLAALDGGSDIALLGACAALLAVIWISAARQTDPRPGWLAGLAGSLVFVSGLGYLLQSAEYWRIDYGFLFWIKAAAAVVSAAIVIPVLRLVPRALAAADYGEVEDLRRQLAERMAAHQETVGGLTQTRQQFEQRLRDHAEQCMLCKTRFDAMMRISAQVVWTADDKGQIVEDSPTWRAFTGQTQEEATDKGWRSAIHPDDLERAEESWRKSVDAQQPYDAEIRIRNAAGRWRWMLVKAIPLVKGPGETGEWIGLAIDLTERKEAEERQAQLTAELQERIAERTAQLERAQKLEALGWLTGGVAHDFNNLLSVILGNMQLLQKRLAGDEKSERLIRNAIGGAERGSRLTQLMLAFSQRQECASGGTVNLAQMTDGLTSVLRASLGAGVRIETDVPKDLWPIQADVHMLEMALVNLAVNARDAMPSGGALTISARNDHIAEALNDLAPGDYIRITVADTGEGMDPETLARATEPFFTTKDAGKGSGLGLSMVQDLAIKSGGALRLSSTLGEGSTVKMWLPKAHDDADPAPAPAAEPQRPVSVLVVDDDALTCMATADMLSDVGFEVTEANSGYRALEILKSGRPIDIVVADHAMPGMTGARLAREIRTGWPELPILIASGFAELTEADDMDLPRLNKPYDQKTLTAKVNELVSKSQRSE